MLWALGAALLTAPACMVHQGQTRIEDLAVERARAAHAERRVHALELRLTELEAELALRSERAAAAEQRSIEQTATKLDRLIAAQERLTEHVEQLRVEQSSVAQTSVPPAQPNGSEAMVASVQPRPTSVDPVLSAYIEHLVERAQSGAPPWRGGLSFEKREALRILLDSERNLDVGNPMDL